MNATIAQTSSETTGISNGKLGIWLFLASEVMLFGTLFTTYVILRAAAPSWPRGWEVLNVPLALLNTVVLITSSVTMVMAYTKVFAKDFRGYRVYMAGTLVLGLAFLVIKSFEYGSKFHHGHYPGTDIFYAIYFTMTGLHGIHVIGGMIFNAMLLATAPFPWDSPRFIERVEYAGLYWHFVDIIWIFLFPALYLL